MGSKLTYKISQSLTEKKKKPQHTLSKTYLYVTKHQFDDWNKGIFNSLEKKIHTPEFRKLSLRAYTTKKIQKTNSLKRNKQKLKKLNWKQKVHNSNSCQPICKTSYFLKIKLIWDIFMSWLFDVDKISEMLTEVYKLYHSCMVWNVLVNSSVLIKCLN